MLEQTEDTAQAGQRERKRVRNLEEQVSKVLRDNFRGFSDEQVDLMIVGGVSLRQSLTNDRMAAAARGI